MIIISESKLQQLAQSLQDYRGNGRDDVLFDTRDRGNYGGYHWDEHVRMLQDADPSGLFTGMLLAEMVEATIVGSKVKLDRVLREPVFLDQLARIQAIESEVLAAIDVPRAALIQHLGEALHAVSPEFGVPGTREVTICLRDAVYSMVSGMTLRWLECQNTPMVAHLPLNPEVLRYESIMDFVDALRAELPAGAHLARIGRDHTAIGLKAPGRVAYPDYIGQAEATCIVPPCGDVLCRVARSCEAYLV